MTDLVDKSVVELSSLLSDGSISSVELTTACLERAADTRDLGAFLDLDADGALEQANASDARRQKQDSSGVLDGIPMGLKDIFLSEGLPTTCASKILESFVAPYDGTAVRKLKEAGAVVLGKLNMDEFAMGSSNEHSAFGPAKNPWDKTRVPGGSSGGSAVAVAAGATPFALGTDTGGSIRQPASYTGIVGLKPTYGRVSRYGVIAFASSLDQVGPMTRTVSDCAAVLQIIAGHDPRDSTSADEGVPDYDAQLEKGAKGLTVGLPKEYFIDGIEGETRRHIENAIECYRSMGATIREVSLPHTEYSIAAYYLLCTAEASSNLARYDGVRYGLRNDAGKGLGEMYCQTRGEGFGPEVKRRIMLGTYALSAGYYDAYYRRAQKARTLIIRDFEQAFENVDVLLTPTTPSPAFRLGENVDDPIQMYLADVFTASCNLAGLPGLSLPCGFTDNGLPIGLQLLGPPWSEGRLLRAARAYEREQSWSSRRPAL